MDDSENSVEEIQKLNAANKVEEENDKGVEQYEEKDVPTEFTLQPHHAAQELQAHFLNCPQLSGQLTSSLELSPTFVTESLLSVPSLNLRGDKESSSGNTNCTVVAGTKQENFLDSRIVSATKVSSDDGYNWRKYGQKEVKSPHGSRSYYKCTYLECYAKKIECSDDRNFVVEVIYKSNHNHDPPKKRNCTRERKLALLAAPIVRSNNTCHPVRTVSNIEPPKSLGENIQIKHIPEANQQVSCGSSEDSQRIVLKEHINGHKAKVRVNKNGKSYPVPISKPSKKPKFVVRVAGGVGISGDGYRWRKYGQKMVKGTPHPRNYYRCTSAGCPVRKHIEMANDCKSTLVITYKGMHDHDMPVPKKRHGPPSAPLLAASPASLGTKEINESEAYEKHISAAQWSVDKADELTGEPMNIGGEKSIDSAKTLLFTGTEIKPC